MDTVISELQKVRRFLATNRENDVSKARVAISVAARNMFEAPPLGLDLDGTITDAPLFFCFLAAFWPGKVYIITYRSVESAAVTAESLNIRYDEIFSAATLSDKARLITLHGVKFFFDDMDECLCNIPDDVTVFKIRNDGNFDFEEEKWLYSPKTGKLL